MKKILGIAAGIAGMIFVMAGVALKINNGVSVIGGADGPTSVFVAVKLDGALVGLLIVIGAVLLAAAIRSLLKRK